MGASNANAAVPCGADTARPALRVRLSVKLMAMVLVFSLSTVGLLAAAGFSLKLYGGLRAYVQGESIWARGQKDAAYWLLRYTESHDESDYARYQAAVSLPLADRAARLELDRRDFDYAAAARAYAAGGNAPGDIPSLIGLYRRFSRTRLFAPALKVWADSDVLVLRMDQIAAAMHAAIAGGRPAANLPQLAGQLDRINLLLTAREAQFAELISRSGALVQQLLLGGVSVLALLLLGAGLAVSWWVARDIRASIEGLRRGALRVAAGDLGRAVEVRGADELADLARVFNDMMRHRREAKEFSDVVMEHATNSISVVDRDGRFTMANRRTGELAGRSAESLVGQAFLPLIAPEHRPGVLANFANLIEHGVPIRGHEADVLREDGTRITMSVSAGPLYQDGRVVAMVCTAEDVTERKRNEALIRHSAEHDALTGLPNRALLLNRLEMATQLAQRDGGEVAVLLIDLDNFKRINDSLGHQAGDQVLLEVAARLARVVRQADTVSRLGGDEFVVVLAELRGDGAAEAALAKLTAAISAPVLVDGQELVVTPSIGGCRYPGDGTDTGTLLKHADIAMYHAKASGRSNMQWFSPAMLRESQDKLALGGALRRALDAGQLRVNYQPVVEMKSRRVVGMEALARWQHPQFGAVSPARFVPLAEEIGQIGRLGEQVLRAACAECARLRRDGKTQLRLAVNVSPRQFEQADFAEMVNRILGDSGLEPHSLELEITESMLMRDPEQTAALLRRLRHAGVAIVIDDFGTGYSSLSYLTRFPIDKLKIDRSFVRDLGTDPRDAAVVNAIIAMAHSLGLRVVAEGVETEAQHAYLQARGCNEAQGFLYSEAVPARQLLALAA